MKRNAIVVAYVIVAVALAVIAGHRLFLRDHLLMVDFLTSLGGPENVDVFLDPNEAWLFSVDGWPPPPPPQGLIEDEQVLQKEQGEIRECPNGWTLDWPPIEITGRTRDLARLLCRVEVTQPRTACFCISVPEFLIRTIKNDRVVDFWIGFGTGSIEVYSRTEGFDESIRDFSVPYNEVFDYELGTNHFGNEKEAFNVKKELEKIFQQPA